MQSEIDSKVNEIKITIAEFNAICRFCLERNNELGPIFKNEFQKTIQSTDPENIVQITKSCLGMEITPEDGLPLFICVDCSKQLNDFELFRQKCYTSQEILKSIRTKQEQPDFLDKYLDETDDHQNYGLQDDDDFIDQNDSQDYNYLPENDDADDDDDDDVKLDLAPTIKTEPHTENEKTVIKTPTKKNNFSTKAKKKFKIKSEISDGDDGTSREKKRGRPSNEKIGRTSTAKPKNRPEMCEICGTMQTNIKIHLLIHDSVKAIECAYCGKKFAQKYSLHSHFKIHINERPHQCPICPYKFHQAAHLRRHMCTHTGEKRFKCDMCPRQFAQSGTLNEHRLAHTQNRQVPCTYCDKMFLTKKALRSHIGIHTGERPFKCEVCGLSYVSSSSLSAHRRIHKRENPTIQCDQCQQVFQSRTMWRSHVRDHGLNTLSTHLKVFVA